MSLKWTDMKPSKYNFIFPFEESSFLLYNASSGGFARVDADTVNLLTKMERKEEIDTNNTDIAQVIENLEEGRFIVPEDLDEIALLKILTNARRFGSRSLGLTIAPTLACNFACTYCYEDHVNVTMGAETISAVEEFLRRETRAIDLLGIAWFGGEPLLAVDIIEKISTFIFDLEKDKDFHYESGMVTNGYLLDRKKAEKLIELEITKVQITIDGPQEVHDVRRPLKTGKGTFQRILNNVVDISDILRAISIRVNVDTSNMNQVPELFDILKSYGLKDKIGIYFSPVHVFSTICRDISGDCLSHEVFSRHEINLFKKAVEKGFRIWRYPGPLYGYCGAVNLNSLVIDPRGDFHKCWNTVGEESEAVGSLSEPMKMNSILIKWLSWDPFENRECRECRFLPICMGGCPYLLRTRSKNCDPWKYNLEEMLRLYYSTKPRTEPSAK